MDGLRSRPSKATIATAPPADADDLLRLGDTHVDNASSIEIQIGPAGHSHGDDGSAFNTAHEVGNYTSSGLSTVRPFTHFLVSRAEPH